MNSSTSNLHYQIFTTPSFLEQEEKEWNALLQASLDNIPFLRAEWLYAWWRCFGGNASPRIFVFHDNHTWIAAGAFYHGRFRYAATAMSALHLFANGHSYRSNLIVRAGHEREVNGLLAQVFQQELQQVDLIFLRDVPQGAILAGTDLRREIGCKTGSLAPMLSPFIKIEDSWEDYWAELRGHFRANLRRRLRKLQQLGEVRFVLAASEQEIAHFLQQGLKLEASGWKGKTGTAILATRETRQFYHMIADWAAAHGGLRLFGLFLNDRMIGFDFALEYDHRLYLLKTAYAEDLSRYSPGQILRMFALRWAFERKLSEYEFLGHQMPWKADWTRTVKPHYTILFYSDRLGGRLFYHWQEQLRPRLRRWFAPEKSKDDVRS